MVAGAPLAAWGIRHEARGKKVPTVALPALLAWLPVQPGVAFA